MPFPRRVMLPDRMRGLFSPTLTTLAEEKTTSDPLNEDALLYGREGWRNTLGALSEPAEKRHSSVAVCAERCAAEGSLNGSFDSRTGEVMGDCEGLDETAWERGDFPAMDLAV